MRDRGRVREHGQERGKNGRDGNLCVQKVSVSTGPARGNTVDGLPRASKLKKGCQKIGYFGAKNGNISRSVNSFGTGAIFRPSSGHDLSRNAFVSRFLFPERNSDCSKDFCMTHKMTKNYKKSNFSESLRDSARRLPGWFQGPLGVFEACWNDFPRCQTKIEKSKFLVRKHVRSSFFTLNSCCVMFISLSSGFFCRGGDIALQSE